MQNKRPTTLLRVRSTFLVVSVTLARCLGCWGCCPGLLSFLKLLSAIAEFIRFRYQSFLSLDTSGVIRISATNHIRLHAQQNILVDQCVYIPIVEFNSGICRGESRVNVTGFFVLGNPEITECLFPVEGRNSVKSLWVIGFNTRPLFEGIDG